jgi:hypothetical protein
MINDRDQENEIVRMLEHWHEYPSQVAEAPAKYNAGLTHDDDLQRNGTDAKS